MLARLNFLDRHVCNDEAQAIPEYALIVGVISILVITALGTTISGGVTAMGARIIEMLG